MGISLVCSRMIKAVLGLALVLWLHEFAFAAIIRTPPVTETRCHWYQKDVTGYFTDTTGTRPITPPTTPDFTFANAGACASDATCKFCVADAGAGADNTYGALGVCIERVETCPANTGTTTYINAIPLDDMLLYDWLKGEVYPNKYAYFTTTPKNKFNMLHVVARTVNDDDNSYKHLDTRNLGDNLDLYIKRGSGLHTALSPLPTTDQPMYPSNYDYSSIRESNPWAIDISQSDVAAMCSTDYSTVVGGKCTKSYVIGVMGDNQFPQKSGASQFEIRLWWEFNFPQFDCGDPATTTTDDLLHNACMSLRRYDRPTKAETSVFVLPSPVGTTNAAKFVYQAAAGSDPARYKICLANGGDLRNKLGSIFYSEKLLLTEGFETTFKFRISSQTECGSPSGFCGGGDGFTFMIFNPTDDEDSLTLQSDWLISGTGEEMGYSGVPRSFVIEFDTWHNPSIYDPKQGQEHWWINATEFISYADNHISMMSYGGQPNSHDHSSDSLIAATPSIPNLSDGLTHTIKLWYMPRAGQFPGSLSIFFDDSDRPALVADVTLENQKSTSNTKSHGGTCAETHNFAGWFDVHYSGNAAPVANSPVAYKVAQIYSGTPNKNVDALRIWPREFNFTSTNWQKPVRVRVGINPDAIDDPTSSMALRITPVDPALAAFTTDITVLYHDTISSSDPKVLVRKTKPTLIVSPPHDGHELIEEFTLSLTHKPYEKLSSNPSVAVREAIRVTITTDNTDLVVTPNNVLLDASNWNHQVRVKVTYTGSSGNVDGTITLAAARENNPLANSLPMGATYVYGASPKFAGLEAAPGGAPTIAVRVLEDTAVYAAQTHGITYLRSDGAYADTINIRLLKDPGGTVTITLKSQVGAQDQIQPDSKTFDSSNWYLFQKYILTRATAGTGPAVLIWECTSGSGACPAQTGNLMPDATVTGYSLNVQRIVQAANPSKIHVLTPRGNNYIYALKYDTDRCVLDQEGRAYIGFTAATGDAGQKMEIESWSFCQKLGCVGY